MSSANETIEEEISLQSQFVPQIDRSEVTVIVPTLNEEKSIGLVLENLLLEGYTNILVVDGNSIDNTINNAKKFNVEIIQQKGRGKAGAIKTAIEVIRTPYLVLIDADSTYNPNEIDRLLEEAPFYNQVIGVRQDRVNIKKINRFGNDVINGIFNFFFGTDLKDACSGMYSLKTNFAKEMKLFSDGFDIEVEIAAYCSNSDSIKEVPISYNKRIGIQKLNSFRDGAKIISSIFNLGRKFNPIVFYSLLIAAISSFSGVALLVLSNVSGFNVPVFPVGGVLSSLLLTTGIQFIILAIILSQIKYQVRHNNLKQIKKKREYPY